MAKVHVVKIPRVSEPLCWKQGPLALGQPHCDRRKHGKRVAHTWEMEAEILRLRQYIEAAFAEGVLSTATSTDQINAGLAKWPRSRAKARVGPK